MARCVNGSCNNDARFSVYRDDLANTYDGISWCSIRCMTSTPSESLRTAVPDWLVERPDTEAASGD